MENLFQNTTVVRACGDSRVHSHSHSNSRDHADGFSHNHSNDEHASEQGYALAQNLEVSQEERLAEESSFLKVIKAFKTYEISALSVNQKRKRDFELLDEGKRRLLSDFRLMLDEIDVGIRRNQKLLDAIVSPHVHTLNESRKKGLDPVVIEADYEKVRSTIKQFVRDWSDLGRGERESTYEPIMEAMERRYGFLSPEQRGDIKVLVPGAGLGRLAYDIVKEGFSCQGNEFSFYMLIASNFILNEVPSANYFELNPFIHTLSNTRTAADITTPIRIPSIVPGNLPITADFSMVAGDFLEVYGAKDMKEAFDCVVTCFFIDTAHVPTDYIETIHYTLKPQGTWVNLGPLLYHYENTSEQSIEIPLDMIKEASRKLGFVFLEEATVRGAYASNPKTMLKYLYESAMWVCEKRL